MTIEELVKALGEVTAEDREKLVIAIQGDTATHPIFQAVFDKGHGEATRKGTQEKESLNTRISALEAEGTAKDERITALGEKNPDVAKIEEKYQTRITEIEEAHKVEKANLQSQNQTLVLSTHRKTLATALIRLGVDPDYADFKADNTDRLQLSDKGTLDVMREGLEIPYAPVEGKSTIDLLANDMLSGVKDIFRTSNADRGSNMGGDDATGGAQKSKFDKIREDAVATRKAEAEKGGKSLEDRLGMTTAT